MYIFIKLQSTTCVRKVYEITSLGLFFGEFVVFEHDDGG